MSLDDDDKKLIRRYMIKVAAVWFTGIVTASGLGAAAVVALLKEDFYLTTYTKSLDKYTERYLDNVKKENEEFGKQKEDVIKLQTQVTLLLKEASSAEDDAKATLTLAHRQLDDLEGMLKSNLDPLVDKIVAKGSFVSNVSQSVSSAVTESVNQFRQRLLVWGDQTGTPEFPRAAHDHDQPEVTCPQGSYVTGMKVIYGGTCHSACAPDGGPVQSIVLKCTRIGS